MFPRKHYFRKIKWLYKINAGLKCVQTKRKYRAVISHYNRKDFPDIRAWPSLKQSDVPNIFFMGTDEQQDKSGFVQALERIANVRYFTREDGSWGQNDPAPYALRREQNTDRLWFMLSELAQNGWKPDLLLMQTWGCLIDPAILSHIRDTYGCLICNVSMDDRHQYWGVRVNGVWDGTYSLIPHLDLALTAAPEAVDWYKKEGCTAIYFPEASDPTIFHPFPSAPKLYDVTFVGSRYGIREKIVLALREAGIDVVAFGSGWEQGRIATEDVPLLFAQSKVILGVSAIGHCQDFVGLKLRDFDGPMSGSCYLTQHNDDLKGLYTIGREIETYRSVQECVDKAGYLLTHNAYREAIAKAGFKRACQDHTWDKRFASVLAQLV